jgi:beta-glucosidase
LLQNLLRDELGFDGLVISDLGAVGQLHTKHGVADGSAAAMAQALRAGVHLDLASENSAPTIVDAVHRGLLAEDAVDAAVARELRAKIDARLFERPFVDLDAVPQTLHPEATRALARQIAEESVILLRNEAVHGDLLLPLDPAVGSFAVIGHKAERPLGQIGNYSYQVLDSVSARFAHAADPTAHAGEDAALSGRTSADDATLLVESVPVVTFLEGIRRRVSPGTLVRYAVGCAVQALDRGCFAEAIAAAEDSGVAVVVVGGVRHQRFRHGGRGSRQHAASSPAQRELVEAVVAPVRRLSSCSATAAVAPARDGVGARSSAPFGGEAGTASRALFATSALPGGSAGMPSDGGAPVPWRGSTRPSDATLRPAFPFGHGLSYTTFTYDDLRVETRAVPTDGCLRVAFRLTNSGAVAGDEVVQLYAQDPVGRSVRRPRVLVGYRRLRLEAGESTWVTFEVPSTLLAEWTAGRGWIVDPGRSLFVGASSSDIRLRDQLLLGGSTYRRGRPAAHELVRAPRRAPCRTSPLGLGARTPPAVPVPCGRGSTTR